MAMVHVSLTCTHGPKLSNRLLEQAIRRFDFDFVTHIAVNVEKPRSADEPFCGYGHQLTLSLVQSKHQVFEGILNLVEIGE